MRRPVAGLVLLFLLAPAGATAQTGDLRSDLDDLDAERGRTEQRLDVVRAREGDARAALAEVSDRLDEAEAELAVLVAELARTEAALATALAAVEAARTRLAEVDTERQLAEAELEVKRAQLDARVVAAFKYGQVSFLEAFVGTKDIVEFLNSSTYIGSVLDGDRALVEDVTGLLAAVEAQRLEAQSLRAEAEREAAVADAATAEVERATRDQRRLTALIAERRDDRERALAALAEDRSAIESHLAGLEAEGQRIGDQLATIAAQQAEQQRRDEEAARRAAEEAQAARLAGEAEAAAEEQRRGDADAADPSAPPVPPDADGSGGADDDGAADGVGGGSPEPVSGVNWRRPVDGHVTSVYGPRWGRNHNGVDLAGSVGTAVVASRPGLVVHVTASCHPTSSFGCGGGFGNYVTVAHDGGMATIYAHLSSVAVGVGQMVDAGQSLGAVGNSGSSYGAHLHFEVREAGQPRNPCSYIAC